jgi:acetyl/propionyl-CoA carboxylase alpha subunit
MDSLMNCFYAGWIIELNSEHGVSYIRRPAELESYLVVLRLMKMKQELAAQQTPVVSAVMEEIKTTFDERIKEVETQIKF